VYAAHSSLYNKEHGDLEVTALCNFVMTNEIFGSVSIDYLRPSTAGGHDDDRIRIVGTEGIIEVRDRKLYLTNKFTSGTEEITFTDSETDGKNIFSDFMAQVRGEKKCLISAEDSFYVTEAALLARTSADEKKEIRFQTRI
jgi:predicted dehydrogenase